ncbi:MAG: antitoxin VbhA family protein [Anaeromusa sp.]|uniref:antitoxin VbhA family protein n=1 Tax=Anaeromusa sp. TaxID=1872520 RepID=UPI002B20077F|nr:antitoxin VbhA family protein [Anaeromusa sp.]MEA4835286.1 antitoxin VbhA family protein [Anaeromusa sp.]
MNRKEAVEYALQTHRLEGFNYTPQEKEMWDKIANGEIPLDAAFKDAAAFAVANLEKRIYQETGEEMTRGIKLITLKYEGFAEEVEMPGWYTADKEHGIHNSDDMQVSNAALLRLKAKTKEE